MTELVEDPDHMMELGQYYAEFKQYDEAIECFSWEMELYPADAVIVWDYIKYLGGDGRRGHLAYGQVYNELVKIQEIG